MKNSNLRKKSSSRKKLLFIPTVFIAGAAALAAIQPAWFRAAWIRTTFGISDCIRDRGLKDLEGIDTIDDISYGNAAEQVMDIYFPAGTTTALPTIVNVHGGGYAYGDKELYRYYCMSLAEHGFTVVNFSYRLAPESRYPAQIEDVNSACIYALSHAEEYHIDPNHVFMVGDSAGAQLASQYAVILSNPEYREIMNMDIPSLTLSGMALNCGVYDPVDSGMDLSYYLEKDLSEYGEQLKVLDYITENYPPAYIMSSTGDMCLPFAEPMSRLLTERGVPNELHIYGDDKTKPGHVFHCNMKSDLAARCNAEECDFFHKLHQSS